MYGFFQDQNGNRSSTRLAFIGGFLVSSAVISWLAYVDKLTEGYFSAYLVYCVGGYGIGKWRDSKEAIAETEADKPAPTVISDNTKVETQTGDINVKPKTRKK